MSICQFFFLSVRKESHSDGDNEYEPCTLKGMQSSLERYLKEQKYGESIITGRSFFQSREAIASKCRELKKKGKGNRPCRKRAPSQNELNQMWEKGALGSQSPKTLQNTIWWIMCTRFGKRGNKENYDMRWGDVQVQSNADGTKYLTCNERETKTRQGHDVKEVREEIKVYEDTEELQYCPVRMFELYAQKRPVEMLEPGSKFYLQPKFFTNQESMEQESVWYKKQVYICYKHNIHWILTQ